MAQMSLLNSLYQQPQEVITDDSIANQGELLGWLDHGLPNFADDLVDSCVNYMQRTMTGRCVAIGQIVGWFGEGNTRTSLLVGFVMFADSTEEHYKFIFNHQCVEVEAQHLPVIRLVLHRLIRNFVIEKMKLGLPTIKDGMIWTPIHNSTLPLDINVVA